jgi:hypothetical protein
MKPIDHDANPRDPRWELEFLRLAHGLVMLGAKTRLIARLTTLPLSKIRKLYKALRSTRAPSGPVFRAQARYFAIPSAQTSASWSVQCAIFLACYEDIGEITEINLHRGWRLLAAFKTYLALTTDKGKTAGTKRLDINQAYALLTHCGFLEAHGAELQRTQCPKCLINYLVVTTELLETQHCPVCAINTNARRLVRQGSPFGPRNAGSRSK